MSRALAISLALHGCLLLALTLAPLARHRPALGSYPRAYRVGLVVAAPPVVMAAAEPVPAVPRPAAVATAQPRPNVAPKQQTVKGSRMPAPGPALPAGMKILAADGGSDEGSYYLGVIMAKISRHWNNPYQGGQGELRTRIYFRINRSGQIEAVSIEQPSGNAVFDQAGLRAVYLAKNFPPLPPEIPSPALGVHFEFEYLK